jgi:DHA2 family multidrug resistance protein-like MFS transporter
MIPWSLAYIVGSNLTPVIARRVRPSVVMGVGLVIAAVGFALVALADRSSGFALIMVSAVIYSLGLSPVVTLATDLIVGSAPPERAGAASAISETSSELGGALGIAILGSIGTAVYRSGMVDVIPQGLPPEAAAAARGTLGGAVSVADQLPDQIGAALLAAGRESFFHAMQLASVVCAVIVLASAVMVYVVLRRVV